MVYDIDNDPKSSYTIYEFHDRLPGQFQTTLFKI